MIWIPFLLMMLSTVSAKDPESNEIIPTPPSINIDANFRRALLKALTELENEDKHKEEDGNNVNLPNINTQDRIVEKASASAISFYLSTSTTEQPSSTTAKTEKPLVFVQKSSGVEHHPIGGLEKAGLDLLGEAEHILTSATNSFSSPDKFSAAKNELVSSPNSLRNDVKTTTRSHHHHHHHHSTPKSSPTTPAAPTVSTEENEAKVEDVQFFSAPLVAAFTVHQDETGVPKRVIPIYKNPPSDEDKAKLQKQKEEQLKLQEQIKQQEHLKQQQIQNQFRTQLVLQEKQKALEEEILRLKQQQQQQNYLIRQQQLLHEQQLHFQKQKLEEQIRIRTNERPFIPIISPNSPLGLTTRNHFEGNSALKQGTFVTFQPSIALNSNQQQQLPLNAQILPIKNAVDFRTPFFRQPQAYQPFSFDLNQVPPPIVQTLPALTTRPIQSPSIIQTQFAQTIQPPIVHSISPQLVAQNSPPLLPTVQPPIQLTTPKHNRVFRQEVDTGNFGFNFNQIPSFQQQQQQQQQQQNRFFRSNLETAANYNTIQPPLISQQLKSLLYNSGIIRGKQNEDLNIISKVLSLNHYGGERPFRYANSNLFEQRLAAPFVKAL